MNVQLQKNTLHSTRRTASGRNSHFKSAQMPQRRQNPRGQIVRNGLLILLSLVIPALLGFVLGEWLQVILGKPIDKVPLYWIAGGVVLGCLFLCYWFLPRLHQSEK